MKKILLGLIIIGIVFYVGYKLGNKNNIDAGYKDDNLKSFDLN